LEVHHERQICSQRVGRFAGRWAADLQCGAYSQGERHGPDLRHVSSLERSDYADRVVRGGFPEAVARDQPRRRQRFFDSYVSNLITRDVSQVGEIEKVGEMEKLIRLIAARSGGQLVINELAGKAGLANHTVARTGRLAVGADVQSGWSSSAEGEQQRGHDSGVRGGLTLRTVPADGDVADEHGSQGLRARAVDRPRDRGGSRW